MLMFSELKCVVLSTKFMQGEDMKLEKSSFRGYFYRGRLSIQIPAE